MIIQKYLKMKSETINRILETARLYKERIAYISDDCCLSYGELITRSKKLSKILSTYKEKNVVLFGNKEFFMPISIVSCLLSNKTYIPIDYHFPISRIKDILKSIKDFIIISERKIEGLDNQYSIESIKETDLINSNESNTNCYIIYTSGSSGKQKGVPISYKNLDNFTSWVSSIYPLKTYKNCVVLNQSSFSFDLSVADFYYTLCNGHTLIAYNNHNDSFTYIYDLISKHKVNVIFSTPSFIRMCLLNKDFNEANYPSLSCIYFCGERLNKKIVKELSKRFKKLSMINAYGPTEATSAVSAFLIQKELIDEYPLLPCGVIDEAACEIKIVDDEIVLSGKSVFENYLENKEVLSEYKTGDYGEINDGLLFCKGRKDNQIKYSGYRIELEEIEERINNMPDVELSVVHPNYSEDNEVVSLTAYIKRISKELSKEMIKDNLKEYLPKYMIPSNIVFVSELKINKNGKVQRGLDYDRCKESA